MNEKDEYRIPYDLQNNWEKASIFFAVCDIFHGSSDAKAKPIIDKLSIKFRLDLSSKFRQDYLSFARFKPELLTYKNDKENYVVAYNYGAFSSLIAEIEQDLKGESEEAKEAKIKAKQYAEAFESFKNGNPNKRITDYLSFGKSDYFMERV